MRVRWPGVVLVALLVVGTLLLKSRIGHDRATATLKVIPSVVLVADPGEANDSDDGCAVIFRAVRQAAKRGVAVAELPPDSHSNLLRQYHVLTVPTVLVLDKTGKEIGRFEGEDATTVKAVQERLATLSGANQ